MKTTSIDKICQNNIARMPLLVTSPNLKYGMIFAGILSGSFARIIKKAIYMNSYTYKRNEALGSPFLPREPINAFGG